MNICLPAYSILQVPRTIVILSVVRSASRTRPADHYNLRVPQVANADAIIVLQDTSGRVCGHCSLFWSSTPSLAQPCDQRSQSGSRVQRTGFIGHFELVGPEYAKDLLQAACRELRGQGCDIAVGPMDGNTWHRYRLVTHSDPAAAPFFMEPANPGFYPAVFRNSGFEVLARYYSTKCDSAAVKPSELIRYRERLAKSGVTLRSLDAGNPNSELKLFYEISRSSFGSNFLYQPISEEEFFAMYKPLLPLLNPELVLVAEVDNHAVGYMLMVPDVFDGAGGTKNIIAKTAARIPGKHLAGLGSLMLLEAQDKAFSLGYASVTHALMHESNSSLNICRRYGRIIRQYELFSKVLVS